MIIRKLLKQNSFIYWVLLLIQVLFGVNFSASKVVVSHINPVLWSNLRFLIAGILMLIISLVLKRKHPKIDKEFILPLIPLSLLGMSVGQTLFMVGLRNTTSVNTAILTTTIPMMTLLIVVLRRQESLTWTKAIGFALAIGGVLTVKGIENLNLSAETFKGDLMIIGASLCFALFLSFSRNFVQKYDNFWVTTWMFLISGVLMSFFNINEFTSLPNIIMDPVFINCAIYSIVGATILTYFLNNWALKRVPSGNVALFIYLQPVVAACIGVIFLKESITMRMAIGSLLIFAGLFVTIIKKKKA
jgi:drug/metabolite transporter (DMT)-like permease